VAAKKVIAVNDALNSSAAPQSAEDALREIAAEAEAFNKANPQGSSARGGPARSGVGSKAKSRIGKPGSAARSGSHPPADGDEVEEVDEHGQVRPRTRTIKAAPGIPNSYKYAAAVVASACIALGMYAYNQSRSKGAGPNPSVVFKEGFISDLQTKEDPAYIRFLVDEFHDPIFGVVKIEGKDGAPATYDQVKYINLMKARIKKQLAQPDPELMKKWEAKKKKK
jgi:hypothetical protein